MILTCFGPVASFKASETLDRNSQAQASQRFACPVERDRQAYDAQRRWLALLGSDLSREFGIDRLSLLVATTCEVP